MLSFWLKIIKFSFRTVTNSTFSRLRRKKTPARCARRWGVGQLEYPPLDSHPRRSHYARAGPRPLPQGRKDDTHQKSIKNHAPRAEALLSGQHSLLFVGVVSFSMTFRWEITISRARFQFRQLFEQFLPPLPITPARRGRTTEPFITYLPPAVSAAQEPAHYLYTDSLITRVHTCIT